MMGLKAKSEELEDLAGTATAKPEELASLDGFTDAASLGAAAVAAGAAEPAESSESLFQRVRTKYSLLAGRGRL
jgi:hypothetical protein